VLGRPQTPEDRKRNKALYKAGASASGPGPRPRPGRALGRDSVRARGHFDFLCMVLRCVAKSALDFSISIATLTVGRRYGKTV